MKRRNGPLPPLVAGIVVVATLATLTAQGGWVLWIPALLALASLAGLAVAWWAFRRLVAREGSPLAPLRQFRFNDGLVWLLVAGGVLLLAGAGYGIGVEHGTARAGSNLLLFTAALYALRGLAVLLVIAGAPGPVGMVLGGVLLLLLYPLVMATTFFVGLTVGMWAFETGAGGIGHRPRALSAGEARGTWPAAAVLEPRDQEVVPCMVGVDGSG